MKKHSIRLSNLTLNFSNQKPKQNENLLNGNLIMFNTIEEFKEADKKQLMQNEQQKIWNSIKSTSFENLSELNKQLARFILLAFVDIKKYKVIYWFSFPAFNYPNSSTLSASPTQIKNLFNSSQLSQLKERFYSVSSIEKTYFIVCEEAENDGNLSLHSILDYAKLRGNKKFKRIYFAFSDASTSQQYPGWTLRNLIAILYLKFQCTKLDVLAIRIRSNNSLDESLILEINLTDKENSTVSVKNNAPESVGFERNELKKLLPKCVDLSSNMDPKKLIESAVDLNLKLMRWRLMPSLRLETIGQTKCLLLGSGTLGCNVARNLLGWGIKHITFLDNGKGM